MNIIEIVKGFKDRQERAKYIKGLTVADRQKYVDWLIKRSGGSIGNASSFVMDLCFELAYDDHYPICNTDSFDARRECRQDGS